MTASQLVDPQAAVDAEPGFEVFPGQTVSSPWLILGLFDGTLGDSANALRAYLADDRPRSPTWASSVLPVAWNSWFAYGRGVDAPTMRAEAALAPRFGVEAFYVDYGWEAALGDWTPHPQRFPGAPLRQLRDEVRRLGMRFGLWVAFGVADRDSQLLRRHPDFVARQPEPARTGIDGSIPLCLTGQAGAGWRKGAARIVRDYGLDWLKFDQPMIAPASTPGTATTPACGAPCRPPRPSTTSCAGCARTSPSCSWSPPSTAPATLTTASTPAHGLAGRRPGDPSQPMRVVQQSYGASLAFPPRFLTLWLARGWATAPPGGAPPPGPGLPGLQHHGQGLGPLPAPG